MNKLDSSLVASALRDEGFELTDEAAGADVVLINTCSVRQHAEERVWSHLGGLKHAKESRPDMVVAVIGCMAQRLGAELLEHSAVDIVCGPAQISQMPELVKRAIAERSRPVAVTEKIRQASGAKEAHQLDDFEVAYDSDANHIAGQAFVRAMRGCNNFCSYCIVPYVRGPEVSRPVEVIVEQVRKLAGQGIKQVTLLGQTIDAYEYVDGGRRYRLGDLLKKVSGVDGVEWIRFITSHPGKLDESILKAMADLPKVCPYLHIPAQSGSDRILKAMNRGYTCGEYLELIAKARAIVKDIAIASDFIVGFPGETDEDFAATVELVKAARFKNSFVFKYSPRPGTRAEDRCVDDVPQEVKKQRNTELLAVQNEISDEDNRRFAGQEVEVLVEGLSKKPHLNKAESEDNPQLIGRTATDLIVVFNGSTALSGQFAKVKITKTSALTLFGRLQ